MGNNVNKQERNPTQSEAKTKVETKKSEKTHEDESKWVGII